MKRRKAFEATLLLLGSIVFFAIVFSGLNQKSRLSLPVEKRFGKLQLETDKTYAKQEAPDEFADYHREIRTREGENTPGYPPNYKIAALRQAFQAVSLNKASAPLPWIERGPGNVPGRTRGLIVDPDDPAFNTWFAGSVGGGIWKTTDGGNSWVNKTPNLPNLATTALAMASSNHQILYAGTGEGFFNVDAIRGDGIWKSVDRGENWTQLASTAGNTDFAYVNRLAVHPLDANLVIAATNTGIFRSTTGGVSWTKVYGDGSRRVQDLAANPRNFNTLYAAVNGSGVIKSNDGGRNWTLLSSGITSPLRIELAIAPTDTTRIYAAVETNATTASVLYVSRDAGVSWSRLTQSGTTVNWLSSQGWYDNAIGVHPYDANIVFVGGVQIYRVAVTSANTMTATRIINLTNRPTSVVHVDQHNLTIVPTAPASNRFMILNANDGGVAVSRDGGENWVRSVSGYNTSQFYGADKAPGVSAYIGGMQDNGTWKSPADPNVITAWSAQLGGDGFDVSWHYKDPNKIIGGSQYNNLSRTLDGGRTWNPATTGLGAVGDGQAPFIVTLAKSQSDPDLLFVIGATGVWRSDNFGANWTSSPIASQDWGPLTYGQVEISLANPQIVWAANRMSSTNGRINVSTDGGLTFKAANLYSGGVSGRITGLATHPTDDSTAYALFSFARAPKVLRTTNLGQTWQDLSGFVGGAPSNNGFPDVATYSLLVLPHNPSEIWAGTEIGLFISTNNGASWSYADNGLPAVSIWRLAVVDDQIIAATHGRGVWSVSLPQLVGYEPPVATLSPRFREIGGGFSGVVNAVAGLASPYDSSFVLLDGAKYLSFGANAAAKDSALKLIIPVTAPKTVRLSLVAYRGGRAFRSAENTVDLRPLKAAQSQYSNDFNNTTNSALDFFTSTGFTFATATGFANGALNSPHNYANNQNYTATLLTPITVAAGNATLVYDNVALVEPGEPGSKFGDDDFYDYVVVEGSNDFGKTWKPLADGYDARDDARWLTAYNANQTGTSAMFKTHTLDLLQTFAAREQILIRFRLFADAGTVGWGWLVDNLLIQPNATAVASEESQLPTTFELSQNYPNPFNPSTKIKYALPKNADVKIVVYNAYGQRVRTLVDQIKQNAGYHEIVWNGTNDAGQAVATGMYFYKLTTKDFVRTLKMMFVK